MAFFRKNVTKSREIKTKESRETEVVTKPKVAKVETISLNLQPKAQKIINCISKGIRVGGEHILGVTSCRLMESLNWENCYKAP